MDRYEPKVMFYNTEKGAPLPGERHKMADGRASIPVEVLFNENSSSGEVTPLASGKISYTEQGIPGSFELQEGENIVLGHVQLSARPGVMDMHLANQYADRLVLPLGQENPVRHEGIRATKAVLAASEIIPMMDPWDGARLERHLAYGDEIYERVPYEPLRLDDLKNNAMINTGKLLCGDIRETPIDGATMFDLVAAAGGSFTGDEIREQYANGGHPLDRVPGTYKDADKFLTGPFADFMSDAPGNKHDLATALAAQWEKLDYELDPIESRVPATVGLMHLACDKMGWDFIPTPADAAAIGRSLNDYRNGDTKAFETIIEKSLSQHPQPEREIGYPEREAAEPEPGQKPADTETARKPAMSAVDRMRAMMPEDEKEDDFQFEP